MKPGVSCPFPNVSAIAPGSKASGPSAGRAAICRTPADCCVAQPDSKSVRAAEIPSLKADRPGIALEKSLSYVSFVFILFLILCQAIEVLIEKMFGPSCKSNLLVWTVRFHFAGGLELGPGLANSQRLLS
jgi:hypothetical protein